MRSTLLLALALAACSSTREELPPPQLPQRAGFDPIVAARAEGVDFLASGPDFELRLYHGERIVLSQRDTQLTFPMAAPHVSRDLTEHYATSADGRALEILIRTRPCVTPTGQSLSYTVSVSLDGEEQSGCGQLL